MENQTSFAQAKYAGKKKQTRRERFLGEMEVLVPWAWLPAAKHGFVPCHGAGWSNAPWPGWRGAVATRQPPAGESYRRWPTCLIICVRRTPYSSTHCAGSSGRRVIPTRERRLLSVSIIRQLRWCAALAVGKPREERPGLFTMGLIATREFDMYGDQPELAALINEVQREAEDLLRRKL